MVDNRVELVTSICNNIRYAESEVLSWGYLTPEMEKLRLGLVASINNCVLASRMGSTELWALKRNVEYCIMTAVNYRDNLVKHGLYHSKVLLSTSPEKVIQYLESSLRDTQKVETFSSNIALLEWIAPELYSR